MTTTTKPKERIITKTRAMIPLKLIHDADYNPPDRIAERNLRKLKDSIDTIGLLQPVSVTVRPHVLIDGHRRCAAARLLGWKEIEANILPEEQAEAVYATVNDTGRKMNGAESLHVYLCNALAVVPSKRKQFNEAEAQIGTALLKLLNRKRLSLRVWKTAQTIVRYCTTEPIRKDGYDPMVAKTVTWLCAHDGIIGPVMKALEMGEDAETIWTAVEKNRRIKFTLAVE